MKKFAVILTAMVFLTAGTVFSDINRFPDVPQNHWAVNEITEFASAQIVAGNTDGTFAPDDGVTREQFTKMLLLTFDKSIDETAESSFKDVAKDSWALAYIEAAKEYFAGKSEDRFHPQEYAVREDIATALIKIMGFAGDETEAMEYLEETFSDAGDVSEKAAPYVSLAAQKGLINGYPDGTFAPQKGISRAETVVLLARAKRTLGEYAQAEAPVLTIEECPENAEASKITISGTVTDEKYGTSLFINGEEVDARDSKGTLKWKKTVELTEDKTVLVITAVNGAGKEVTQTRTVTFDVAAPKLLILSFPEEDVETRKITIAGSTTDEKYGVTVRINGSRVGTKDEPGILHFSKDIWMSYGYNEFVVTATNTAGKVSTETLSVRLVSPAPILTITFCPETTNTEKVTIKGTAKDNNFKSTVSINGKIIDENKYSGTIRWEKEYTLKEGDNEFSFHVVNSAGQVTTEKRTITFIPSLDRIKLSSLPSSTSDSSVTVSGTITGNLSGIKLTVNGSSASVSSDGSFSKNVALAEGSNEIIISATNKYGYSIEETKHIERTTESED